MNLASPIEPAADAALGAPARRGDLPLSLALTHGGVSEIMFRYEVVGGDDAPVIVAAGGISAGRHAVASREFAEPGWWQAQAGSLGLPGYRLLSFDWVGADGAIDRAIDPADQAEALVRLLDDLCVPKLAGFVGASYGAMVGLHVASRFPDRCGPLLAISGSGAPHPYSSACRSLQRRAIAFGETIGDRASGVALARAMAMLTYRTPAEFADRFAAPPRIEDGRLRVAADDYLDHHGNRHVRRMSAIAYRRLSESIDLHRVDPGAVCVPARFVAVDSDALVPAADIEAFAQAVPGATFRRIGSRFGHDAFLKEDAAIAAILDDFLASLETSQ